MDVGEREAAAQRARVVPVADAAGLDRTYISGIERKVKNPTITVVDRIAVALRCRLGKLLD